MVELLASYSLVDIVAIIIGVALAFRGVIEFYDWSKERLSKIFNKSTQQEKDKEALEQNIKTNQKTIKELKENQVLIQTEIKDIRDLIQLLIKSDMDDIKSYITEKHHFFCYEQGWIDDYSLECLEKRYVHYVREGGNSFIGGFMEELRKLPKKPN